MASRGQSLTIQYVAWNTSTNAGQTGDAANHTLRLVKNGTSAAPTNAPAEVDATNAPGIYSLTLTTAEATNDIVSVAGKSSTANVSIMPQTVTFEQLPTLAPGTVNGSLPTLDANGDISAKLGAAAQQTMGQIVGGANKRYFVRTDGSGADGLSLTTAYTSIATAMATAAGVAGAEVMVGPGTFTETSRSNLAQYGRLIGAGMDRTTLADSTQINGPIVQLASNTTVRGIRVQGTAIAGNFQYAIGDSAVAVVNAVVSDSHFGTDSDGAYFQVSGSSARFYHCFFDSHWDCMALQAGTGIFVECFGCYFRTTGPNSEAANGSSTLNVAAGNTLRVFDSHVVCTATNTNTSRTTNVVFAHGSTTGAGARIELYDCTIDTNLASTETVRCIYAGTNATVLLQDVVYDPSKVALELSTTGTPTGGTFALTVTNGLGSQTATIPFNDNAAAVQTLLAALSNVGPGNVTASGGILPGGTIILTFAGSLGPVTLSADSSLLTGGISPTAIFGTVIVQNTPINEPGQIAPGALASNAIVPGTIGAGAYTGVEMDLVNAPNATAVAAIQSGLPKGVDYTTARAAKLDNADVATSSRLAASSYVAPDNADIVTAVNDLVSLLARTDPTTNLAAVKTVTDKLNTMLATSGLNWTLTVDALKNAPTGGSGGGIQRQISVTQRNITSNANN